MAIASPFLFHQDLFLQRQGKVEWVHHKDIRIPFFIGQNTAQSPARAPFGSIAWEGTDLPEVGVFSGLIDKMRSFLKERQVGKIRITHYPDAYAPTLSEGWHQALEVAGFQKVYSEVNYHLSTQIPFRQGLHRSERWKCNKLHREGYTFQAMSSADWEKAFPILEESRKRKGYPMTMSQIELADVCGAFPKNYHLHGVFFGNACVAVSVSIEVSAEIDYVFYTGDVLAHRRRSPVVLLHEGLFLEARRRGKIMLDLGTASVQGIVNQGLAQFKEHLGGQVSAKITWEGQV